jgi:cytoskeletal protein RodZ
MYKFFKKRSVHIMRNFLVLVLSVVLGLSCALTIGCQKKPGEEQNKAAEKAAEVKNTADEKAAEIKNTADEEAAEIKNTADEKAAEVNAKADEKAAEVKNTADEKAAEVNAKVAGWDSCEGCHRDSGKPAPSKTELLKRFKTERELIAAAKASKDPMMNNFKKDDLLKAAAKDLGLK